jgi:hypothetical protein
MVVVLDGILKFLLLSPELDFRFFSVLFLVGMVWLRLYRPFFLSRWEHIGLVYTVTITHFQLFVCFALKMPSIQYMFPFTVGGLLARKQLFFFMLPKMQAARGNNSASCVVKNLSLCYDVFCFLLCYTISLIMTMTTRPYANIFDNASSTYLTSLGFDLMAICTYSSVLARAECFSWSINVIYLW